MKLMNINHAFRTLVILAIIVGAGLFSCVPNRQITYIQDKSIEDKSLITKDSLYKIISIKHFEYVLKPEDVLSVRVRTLTEEQEDLNFFNLGMGGNQQNQQQMMMGAGGAYLTGYIVDSKGMIELPVVGKIKVEGKTLEQVKEEIREIAAEYLTGDLVIDIRLMNFQFFILGAVGQSSLFQTFMPRLNILEALSLAGGMAIDADRENVRLYRRNGTEVEMVFLNLLDEKLMQSDYFYIQPNDMIVVDPLPVRNVTLAQGTITTAIGFGLTIFNLILLLSR
jgi:polysaccharide export outer membrane protein